LSIQPGLSQSDAIGRIDEQLGELQLDRNALAPALRALLSLPAGDEIFGRLPAQVVRERTVQAMRCVLVARAKRSPTVVIVGRWRGLRAARGCRLHRGPSITGSLSKFDTDLCPKSVQNASKASKLCQTAGQHGSACHCSASRTTASSRRRDRRQAKAARRAFMEIRQGVSTRPGSTSATASPTRSPRAAASRSCSPARTSAARTSRPSRPRRSG
jgi:hypothetical protein